MNFFLLCYFYFIFSIFNLISIFAAVVVFCFVNFCSSLPLRKVRYFSASLTNMKASLESFRKYSHYNFAENIIFRYTASITNCVPENTNKNDQYPKCLLYSNCAQNLKFKIHLEIQKLKQSFLFRRH